MKIIDRDLEKLAIEKFLDNIKTIEELMQNNYGELVNTLKNSINKSIKYTQILQSKGLKNQIKYISFSILLSSLLTGDYSLGINFYDEMFYLDEVDVFSEWKLPYIYNFVEDSNEMLISNLNTRGKYLNQNYIFEWKQNQALAYISMMLPEIRNLIVETLNQIDKNEFLSCEIIEVTLGLYMEEQTVFYKWR